MRVISILNLKGGVAKTVSAINIAWLLHVRHAKRVLLIDNDKQGNTSKFFGAHSYEHPGLAEVLTERGLDIREAIVTLGLAEGGVDLLPANMNLLRANREILLDCSRPQQTRLAKALESVRDDYDFVVIDNAPDLNMSVMNALVATRDVLIPVKIDSFASDGIAQLAEQVEDLLEFNPQLRIAGCFITMYQQNSVNRQGEAWLRENLPHRLFDTRIRKTVKVDETTYACRPLQAYAPNCTAGRDYERLVEEYLVICGEKVTETSTSGGADT